MPKQACIHTDTHHDMLISRAMESQDHISALFLCVCESLFVSTHLCLCLVSRRTTVIGGSAWTRNPTAAETLASRQPGTRQELASHPSSQVTTTKKLERNTFKQRDLNWMGRALFTLQCHVCWSAKLATLNSNIPSGPTGQICLTKADWCMQRYCAVVILETSAQALLQFTACWIIVSRVSSPLQWRCQTYVGQHLSGSDQLGLSLSFCSDFSTFTVSHEMS